MLIYPDLAAAAHPFRNPDHAGFTAYVLEYVII